MKWAVARDSLLGQIYNRTVSAVRVIGFGKSKGRVLYIFPELGGMDILRSVLNVVAEVNGNGDFRIQKSLVIFRADLRSSAWLNSYNSLICSLPG